MSILASLNSAVVSLPEPSYLVANLELQFKVGGNTFATDSAGNQVATSSSTVIIKASVISQNKTPTDTPLPGSGQTSILLRGRLVSPKYLPPGISLEDQAIAAYTDSVSGQVMRGKCKFLPATQSRVSEITKKFGQRVELEFLPSGVA